MKLSSYYFNEPLGLKEVQQKSMEFSSKIAPFFKLKILAHFDIIRVEISRPRYTRVKKNVINISKLENPLKSFPIFIHE